MNINGQLTGVELAYQNNSQSAHWSRFFIRGDISLHWGTTRYDGGLQDAEGNSTPYQSDSKEFISIFRGLGGAHVYQGRISRLSLYGGFGTWGLINRTQGLGSYEREATYNYLPWGFGFETLGAAKNLALVMTAEYNYFLSGQTISHLEDANPNLPTIKHKQKDGSGFKITVGTHYFLSSITLLTQIYHQAWDIEKSDVVSGFIEPKNTTKMSGLSVGVLF